jgi:hypothetical protein
MRQKSREKESNSLEELLAASSHFGRSVSVSQAVERLIEACHKKTILGKPRPAEWK